MSSNRAVRTRLPILLVIAAATAAVWLYALPPVRDPDEWAGRRMRSLLVLVGATWAAGCAAYLALGRGGLRQRVFRLVLLTASAALPVALCELPALAFRHDYARTFGLKSATTWLQLSAKVNRPDPELIHVHWPGGKWSGEVRGNLVGLGICTDRTYQVDVRYDRNGFRNGRDHDEVDVAVIGDSFVEAALLPPEQSVSGRLERKLGRSTINLGQAAYGLRQELAVLRRYALPLRPKLVAWFLFGGNDLRDVGSYEWRRASFGRLAEPRPLVERSFCRNALRGALALLARERTRDSFAARTRSALFALADGREERVYFGQTNPPWKPDQWRVATETLRDADDLCEAAGAKYLVVYIPRKLRVYRPYVRAEKGSLADRWRLNDLPGALARWCEEAGVAYADSTPHLRRVAAKGEHTYFVDDVHWNARGHEVAAELVAEEVERRGWTLAR